MRLELVVLAMAALVQELVVLAQAELVPAANSESQQN
jgi:hypothetical protein